MRGISLPINAIVIVAIAILVLVVISAFFSGVLIPSTIEIERDNALGKACQSWGTLYNCNEAGFSAKTTMHQDAADDAPRKYSVKDLCEKIGLYETDLSGDIESYEACCLRCGCPVSDCPLP